MNYNHLIEIVELEKCGAIIAIQDGNHGEKHPKSADYVESGIPFIMANDLGKGFVDVDGSNKISELQASNLRIGFAKEGDVLLTHKGTIGNVAIVGPVDPYIMLTPQVTYYRVDPSKASNKFLSYAFRERQFVKRMKSLAEQSTRPYIGITAQRKLKVFWTDLDKQRRIVEKLSPYDDLIENNRRRIELLEESARQLYKEWFVRFLFPGHEHVKIIDGIPDGWEKVTLGDIAKTNVKSHKAKELPEEINYIDIKSVGTGTIGETSKVSAEEAPGRARRIAQHGDVIWSNVRPNLKAYSLIQHPGEIDVFSTGFTVLTADKVPYLYLYQYVTTDAFVAHLVNHATGTSYPAVRPPDFEKAEILKPDDNLLEQYQEACEPSYELIHNLKEQNGQLAQARDLLLPKLMSGEVAV
ncbi:MAG: restriction endonuclease subunit S [Emcibacter sp.]|nr:restriction endonuclease subunit S [Emcibacter sp.]